jgi:Tfp pilus assembly protein PilX
MRETRRKDGSRHDRGFAIVMVLFVIGLLLVLGSALTMTAVMNSQNTVGSDSRQRAYNTAESGVADVITAIENGTITSTTSSWSTGNTFPSPNDTHETYDYQVKFNSGSAASDVQDPLTNTGQSCSSTTTQSIGCVLVPGSGVLITVRGHYLGHTSNAEVVAVSNSLQLNGYTLLTKGDAGTNGNGNIAADPCNPACAPGVPTVHNVKAFTDGSFNGGKGLIDGSVLSVGTATATIPSGCTPSPCVTSSGQTAIAFPSSNSLAQEQNQWKNTATGQGHFYSSSASLPSSITINSGDVWYIDQSIDLKNVAITNDGGMIVVTGSISESGNKSAANYGLSDACDNVCTCRSSAILVDLSTSGVSIHGQGTGKGHLVSQGVIFAPSGPATNIGNASMQAAIVAASAQIGGSASMTADTCAATATIGVPGYNITGYGEY